jgi:DamX protein
MSDGIIRAAAKNEASNHGVIKPISWMANIDFIKKIILSHNILISVLGEQGSGKTVFAHLLQDELPSNIKSHLIIADSLMDDASFLQQLTGWLDEHCEPTLSNAVAYSNEQACHQLLIIDDAHFLTEAVIENILKALLRQGQAGYFHVCLISDFSLVSTYHHLAKDIYCDMIHSIELGSFSESETKAYLAQKSSLLPGAETSVTDERAASFYQQTEGHVAAINQELTNGLNERKEQLLYKIKRIVQASCIAGTFLAATLGVYVWLSQDIQPPPTEMVSIPFESSEVALELPLDSELPSYDLAVERKVIEATSLRRIELTEVDDPDFAPNESLVVMDKVVVAPKILHVKEKQKTPIVAKKSTHIEAQVLTKQRISVSKSVNDKGRYTIQLLAGRNKETLQRFANTHHFNVQTHIHHVMRQGKDWYVLTLGVYPKREQAKQAVYHLPGDLAQYGPWVRLLSDLQAAG